MTCAVCKRAGRGFGFALRDWNTNKRAPTKKACSMDCLETLRLAGRMELHFNEPEAVTAGGKRGGKYLEMIGKYDLRELTPTEWFDFCAIIFEGTTDHLREQAKSQIKPEPHVRQPS